MSNADFDTLHMTPRPGPAAHPSPAEPLKTPARGHPYASNPGRIATSRRSPTRQPPGPTSPKPQYLQAIHRQFSPPRGSLQKSHTPTADDRSARLRRSRPACASPRTRSRDRSAAATCSGNRRLFRLLTTSARAARHRRVAAPPLKRPRAAATFRCCNRRRGVVRRPPGNALAGVAAAAGRRNAGAALRPAARSRL